jgi:hypothetical protein
LYAEIPGQCKQSVLSPVLDLGSELYEEVETENACNEDELPPLPNSQQAIYGEIGGCDLYSNVDESATISPAGAITYGNASYGSNSLYEELPEEGLPVFFQVPYEVSEDDGDGLYDSLGEVGSKPAAFVPSLGSGYNTLQREHEQIRMVKGYSGSSALDESEAGEVEPVYGDIESATSDEKQAAMTARPKILAPYISTDNIASQKPVSAHWLHC